LIFWFRVRKHDKFGGHGTAATEANLEMILSQRKLNCALFVKFL
jgi:hypothetical protein